MIEIDNFWNEFSAAQKELFALQAEGYRLTFRCVQQVNHYAQKCVYVLRSYL